MGRFLNRLWGDESVFQRFVAGALYLVGKILVSGLAGTGDWGVPIGEIAQTAGVFVAGGSISAAPTSMELKKILLIALSFGLLSVLATSCTAQPKVAPVQLSSVSRAQEIDCRGILLSDPNGFFKCNYSYLDTRPCMEKYQEWLQTRLPLIAQCPTNPY